MTSRLAPSAADAASRPASNAGQTKLARNATGLVLGKAAQTGLGFLFWVVAARLFTEAEVGAVAAMVAATMLSIQFSIFGVDAAFISLYSVHDSRRGALLGSALALVSFTSLISTVAIVIYALLSDSDFGALADSPMSIGAFLLAAMLGTYVVLFERVSVARRRGHEVLVRNVANGVVSIFPFLAIWAFDVDGGSTTLFAFWLGGIVAAFGFCIHHNTTLDGLSTDRHVARDLVRVGMPNYLLASAERLPMLVLPVVIVTILGASTSAHWYTTWQMAFAVYSIPIAVGTALFAEGASNRKHLDSETRRALSFAFAIAIPCAATAAILAPVALGILGPSYADAGTKPLRILLVGVVPFIFVQAYYAVCRATGRLREASVLAATIAIGSIGGVVVVASRFDLSGIATIWILSITMGALWALPRTVQLLRLESIRNGES